jgi:hypothetical protein
MNVFTILTQGLNASGRALTFAARIFVVFSVVLCMGYEASASGANISGNWEAKVMGVLITTVVQQNGEQITGVSTIHNRGRKKDTYTFHGFVKGGHIEAAHSDGHGFSGNVVTNGRIEGSLTTKKGYTVPISARRK